MKFICTSAVLAVTSTLLLPAAAAAQNKHDDLKLVGPDEDDRQYLRHAEELKLEPVKPENINFGSGAQEIIGGFEQTTVLPWFVRQLLCDSSGSNCGLCGATLVHSDIVLTAAHCVFDNNLPATQAVAGALNVDFVAGTTDGTVLSTVSDSLLIHPNYDTNNIQKGYDIAMYKISPTTNSVVSLNSDTSVPTNGQTLYLFGHGDTVNGGSNTVELRGLQTNAVVPCPSSLSEAIDQHVCLFASSSSGACSGDSGGPVVTSTVTSDPTAAVQLGLSSYVFGPIGAGCAAGNPDVYLDVSFFSSWIQAYICSNSASPPASCSNTAPSPSPTRTPTSSPTVPACFFTAGKWQSFVDNTVGRFFGNGI